MSDYLDNLQKTTASNYSMQPGSIHPSFPAQASGGNEEHDDHSDTYDYAKSANIQMNTRVNAMREERAIQDTAKRPSSDAFK